MFTAYILFSKKLGKYYIGSTRDFKTRIRRHNSGRVKFTKYGRPWVLAHKEEFQTRAEAYKREREIKSYKGGLKFKRLLE
jgi:putative endonuclease